MIGQYNFELIQIFALIFALFAWSRVFLRYKDKSISKVSLLFWSVIWIAIISVALNPYIITATARFLGIGRAIDVLVYISIIVIFYLMFRLYVKMDGLTQQITMLVRKIAIDNAKKVKEKKK